MNATDIVGYAFDGAEYHVECLPDVSATCECDSRDENGICDSNCHGYGPNPIFGDEDASGCCDACRQPVIESELYGADGADDDRVVEVWR